MSNNDIPVNHSHQVEVLGIHATVMYTADNDGITIKLVYVTQTHEPMDVWQFDSVVEYIVRDIYQSHEAANVIDQD